MGQNISFNLVSFDDGHSNRSKVHRHALISAKITILCYYPARALRALGLLLADGAPTVGGGKTF